MEPRDPKESRQRGWDFEALFEKMCRFEGLLVRKIPLSCRPIGNNQFLPVKSELDWQVGHSGITAFIDTKSQKGATMVRSAFNDDQVDVAVGFNSWDIPAGFIVFFREINRVVFFTGAQIHAIQSGSVSADEGLELGTGFDFSVRKIFAR